MPINTDTNVIAKTVLLSMEHLITPETTKVVNLNITRSGQTEVFNVVVSYTKPSNPSTNTGFIDADPTSPEYASLQFFFGSVYTSPTDISSVKDVFFGGSNSGGAGGTVALTPEVQAYIDSQVIAKANIAESNANSYTDTQIASTTNYIDSLMSHTVQSVQLVSDLTAITNLFDKKLVFAEETNSIYAYDLQSTKPLDTTIVVASSTGVGRWEKVVANTTNTAISGGTF